MYRRSQLTLTSLTLALLLAAPGCSTIAPYHHAPLSPLPAFTKGSLVTDNTAPPKRWQDCYGERASFGDSSLGAMALSFGGIVGVMTLLFAGGLGSSGCVGDCGLGVEGYVLGLGISGGLIYAGLDLLGGPELNQSEYCQELRSKKPM